VATPLLAPEGNLIAAISAAVDASEAARLDAIGEQLKKVIATWGGSRWHVALLDIAAR
jgi:IclR family acetate operon transcriptional repressor